MSQTRSASPSALTGYELFLTLSCYFDLDGTISGVEMLVADFAQAGALMDRRGFLNSATATGLAVGRYTAIAHGSVPERSWDKCEIGTTAPTGLK